MTPLVIVHGFMGGSDQWRLQAPLGNHYTLVCVDLPGFGRNAHLTPIHQIEDFAQWVLDEATRLGHQKFHLMGHSMGGMIVQDMVRLAPERVDKLILYGTGSVGALPGRFEPIRTSMQRAIQDGAEATARRISATWFKAFEQAEHFDHCADIAALTTLPALLAGLEAMESWSGQAHLSAIQNQTLILWGDEDRTYPWSQIKLLWTQIPRSNLAVIPQVSHAVHAENPTTFNDVVFQFLSD